MDTQVYCSLPWWDGPFYSHIVLDCILALFDFVYPMLGAVHILRQPPEGGGGVSQKLTIADEGG